MTHKTKNAHAPSPGPELLAAVRAGFVRQGTSLAGWCRAQELHRANVTTALLGNWRGPKARAVVARAVKAARLERAA